MRKYLSGTLLMVLTTCTLSAQDVKLGIKGGFNLTSMMSGDVTTPLSEDYKSRLAGGAAIFTELQLNQTVSLRFGVEYSGMGGKKDGMQAMPTQRLVTEIGYSLGMGITEQQLAALGAIAMSAPYYYANVENTTILDYVTIPILAQVGKDIGDTPWRVYVNAGPFVSLLLSGKQVTKGTSKLFFDNSGTNTLWEVFPDEVKFFVASQFPDIEKMLNEPVSFGETNTTGEMKSANFGVIANIGLRYQHNRHCFFVEGGGNYGFFTVQDDSANGTNRVGAVSVMFGYAFSLF